MAEPSTNTEMVRVPILGENGRISDDYIPESIPQAVTAVGQAAEAAASSANEALQKAAAAEKAASSASSSAEQAKSYASNANTYMTTAESHAGSAATDAAAASKSASAAAASAAAAEVSNKSAAQSSADAMGFRNNAVQYRDQAREAAQDAQGYVTTVQQLEQNATNSATAAQNSATSASASAETAATAETNASASATAAAASAQTASQKADAVLDHYIESAQATTLEPGSQATATVADNVLQLGIPKGEKGDTGLGIPEGGSVGQVVKKTADGTEWAYDTGAVYNSEEGLQEMAEDGTHDPIYNFGITQGGMSASMSVMGDSPEIAADYSAASVSYRNAIGADADGPYVDLNLTGKTGGATKYRYVDDPSQFATADGIPTAKAVASAIGGGNVLKGTLGPAPLLSADDAYAQKPRKLTVYGNTVQNLWVNPSGTQNGVTVIANANGSVTVSGTASDIAIISDSVPRYILKPNTQYTLSVNKATNLANTGFRVLEKLMSSEETVNHALYGSSTSLTFTTSSDLRHATFEMRVNAGDAVSGTYRVMLNEGSEPEPWCPPGLNSVGDGGSVDIVTAGKNLLNPLSGIDYPHEITSGVQVSKGDGLTFTISGTTQNAGGRRSYFADAYLQPGTYTLNRGTSNNSVQAVLSDDEGTAVASAANSQTVTFEISAPTHVNLGFNALSGIDINVALSVQLELGSTATAYEPPAVTTTPIDLDGNTLCSLPDGTCDELTIDATGAVTLTKLCGLATIDGDATYKASVLTDNIRINANKSSIASSKPPYDNTRPEKFPTSKGDAKLGQIVSSGSHVVSTYIPKELADTTDAAIDFVRGHEPYSIVYPLAEPQTISLPSVTLPTLPAPTVNVWADAEASGAGYAMDPDVELEYERDVTIAFNKLQAQVSELTVNQATS